MHYESILEHCFDCFQFFKHILINVSFDLFFFYNRSAKIKWTLLDVIAVLKSITSENIKSIDTSL